MTKKFFSVFVAVLILVGLVGCAASEKPDQSGVAQSAQKNVSTLTVEKAEEIALNHAGLTRDQVRFDRTEYDIDDGVEAYEIEFRSSDWEYDYKIHGKTGEVLLSEKDQEGRATSTVPSPTQPAEDSSEKLTAEEAEEIALNHAGLTRDQVRFDRTEYDVDDGVPEYEIEFRSSDWEYDYKIQAETGEVLLSEKEQEKAAAVLDPSPTQPTQDSGEKLTAKEAEEIALNHAGLTRDQVRFDRTEYDVDHGTPEYEIEFRQDGWEYSYEIHAKTGKIIANERDRDD